MANTDNLPERCMYCWDKFETNDGVVTTPAVEEGAGKAIRVVHVRCATDEELTKCCIGQGTIGQFPENDLELEAEDFERKGK